MEERVQKILAAAGATAVLVLCAAVGAGERADDAVVFEEHRFELHGDESVIRIVPAEGASNGKAVWVDAGQRGWVLQWPWRSADFLPGFEYDLFVRATSTGQGAASIDGGVYRRLTLGQGKMLGKFRARLTSADAWQRLSVGRLALNGVYGYLYVRTHEAPVLVDSVIAVPVVTDANRGAYRAAMAERVERDRRQREELAAIRSRTRPHAHLGRRFLFGVAMARSAFLCSSEVTGVHWEWEYRQCLRDMKRHYCNFNYQLSVDAVHPELLPTLRIMEDERVYSVNGDVKVLPSIFLVQHSVNRDEQQARTAKLAAKLSRHRYFLAWSLADEPLAEKLHDYIVAKDIIERADPKRPAIPILNTEEVIEAYGPYQQVLVTDFYTIRKKRPDPWAAGDRLGFCRRHTAAPLWLLYGAYETERSMRMPTRAETRVMIHQGILNGATGLACYVYATRPVFAGRGHLESLVDTLRTSTDVWDEIGQVAKQLVPIGHALAEATRLRTQPFAVETVTIDTPGGKRPAIELASWSLGRVHIVLVANNDIGATRSPRITCSADLAGRQVLDLCTMEPVRELGADGWVSRLGPAEAVFYAVGDRAPVASLAHRVWLGRREQERAILELDLELVAKHGIDATPFRTGQDALPAGPALYPGAAQLRRQIDDALERKARFVTARRGLAGLRARLSSAERRIERMPREATASVQQQWLSLARTFGQLRYAHLEARPVDLDKLGRASEQAQRLVDSLR